MGSWDVRFFYLDWRSRNRLQGDFLDLCIDEEGQVAACWREWLLEEEEASGDLTNWKVAREACDVYSELRDRLPAAVRARTDTLLGQLFGFADSDYWPGFAGWEYTPDEQAWLKKAGVNHLLSPRKIQELLPLWREADIDILKQVFGLRPQDTYLNCWEAFLGYIESWLLLLKRAESLGGQGLLLVLIV